MTTNAPVSVEPAPVAGDMESVRMPAAFSIVGVGASAGGLEAFTQLLQCLPADTGLGFVLIQHLDRSHPSLLTEALAKTTAMPVRQAEHGMQVEPNHVYVIAPNTDLAIRAGHLVSSPRSSDVSKPHLPVDTFLRSLAEDLSNLAIGVILSGSAFDGTEGLRAIGAEDGATFVQNPRSAKFPSMPQSALDAAVVDYCLDIPELAAELARLSRDPQLHATPPDLSDSDERIRYEIFARVRREMGVDFLEFKASTVARRLSRRLLLRKAVDLQAYLKLLDTEPGEIRALYEDMLVHVTSFFRDPEMFEALHTNVFPEILKNKPDGSTVRAWVAGCSTGEEVYSFAMAWSDLLDQSPGAHTLQIFGTDLSEIAIQKARLGVYTDSAMRPVSEERRIRYFTKTEGGYRVKKSLRDQCVFVRHDLVLDPPFSKLDIVSCRNVLIYFDPASQKKVLPTLHYCLNQPGYLVLGRSESTSGFSRLFSVTDKANKIFERSAYVSSLRFAPRGDVEARVGKPGQRGSGAPPDHTTTFSKHLDRLLLARYCPPGVLVNEKLEVLLFRGQTGAYLQPAPGPPQHNLVGMARGGLISALRATIAQAKQDGVVVTSPNVEVEYDGASRHCDVVVVPFIGLPDGNESLFVVLFEEPRADAATSVAKSSWLAPLVDDDRSAISERRRSERLEHELMTTKEYLHTLVEDHGRANDEIGTTNEELISANEELQSLNEELETAKEELQSINEELTTLNDELQRRNHEAEGLVVQAQSARAEAERANRSKDDFLATLSHELRTPMSSILLHAQRMRDGGLVEPADLKRTGESLARATWTQVRLIDDLLDVSRIVSDKLTLDMRPVDIGGVVRAALDELSPVSEEKGLAVHLSLEPALGPIWADPVRAKQVVSNLLTNAIKFTPRGGQISVSVDGTADLATVRVTDNGIGIDPEFLPRVFMRFSQSDSSITRTHGGLGLGLSLVRHLVQLQGGTAQAQSAGLGLGATFTVTFPLARPSKHPPAMPDAALLDRPGKTKHYEGLAGLRILVIDDDLWTREAVFEVLRASGAQVELAASAAEGLNAVNTWRPQVIVCDVAMPTEDGYSFIRKLRAGEVGGSKTIPALALTALATEEDRRRARVAGFQLHVAKPIDIDRLREAVLELAVMVEQRAPSEACEA